MVNDINITVEHLAAALAEHREPPAYVRARIVARARRAADPATEGWLLAALSADDEPAVQFRACEALAHVGTERALEALDGHARGGSPAVRAMAGFAHTVISHRCRKASPHLDLPDPRGSLTVEGAASTFDSRPLTPADLARVVHDLDGHARALAPYLPAGIEIRCGDNRWAFVRHDLGGSDLASTLATPCVLGTVAQLDREHDVWVPARVVLAGPRGEGETYVAVYRRDGVLDLFGVGRRGAGPLSIVSAGRPGAVAVSALCHWADVLPVLVGIAGTRRAARRHPELLSEPRPGGSPAGT